ncbi:MAG TPA: hypothetical protein VIK00_06505 [Candidatus Limnocylindrales bacterium]
MQVAVQLLETLVDIGRHGDEQDVEVRQVKPEVATEVSQPQPIAAGVGSVGGLLDRIRFSVKALGEHGRVCSLNQVIDLLLRQVEPTKAVLGIRISGSSSGHGRLDPQVENIQPAHEVAQRGVQRLGLEVVLIHQVIAYARHGP